MAFTYSSKSIESGSGGGGSTIVTITFTSGDWVVNGDNQELTITSAQHGLDNNFIVQVEEFVVSTYQVVDTVVQNNNGNIKLIVGNGSAFNGRVHIKE